MNGSIPSIYKSFKRKSKQKKERKRKGLMAAEPHHVPRPPSSWNYAPRPA